MRKPRLLLICFVFIIAIALLFVKKYHYHFWRKTEYYKKKEVYIKMRDGVKLFTIILQQENKGTHPIIFIRTPYSASGFWVQHFLSNYQKEGYIIVIQDVRGKFMSEGTYENIRPYKPNKQGVETDEASDTYDSIDWLIKNVPGNNNKVGMIGMSYPGFYAALGGLCGHPALKAISPQAPICDWFMGDDIHHNGAFMEADAVFIFNAFGKYRPRPTLASANGMAHPSTDNYKFFMNIGTLKNLAVAMGDSIAFWKDIYNHPDYDEWWRERDVSSYIQKIPPQVASLVVGGMFDAEDCYGALSMYKSIDEKKAGNNKLVMGPWSHTEWAVPEYDHLGNIRFGGNISEWYQKNIEMPFFDYYLQGIGDINNIRKCTMFFTGSNKWETFDKWPPVDAKKEAMFLHVDGSFSPDTPLVPDNSGYNKYISDPEKPVPYSEDMNFDRTKEYMVDDQRFAGRRPDVLVYKTDTLKDDVTIAGPVIADLFTSISTTDIDFVVKVIDVFPDNFAYVDSVDGKGNGKNYPMGGYQMLVRGEVMRGRYRNSFETPEAFTPGEITEVKYVMPDIAHVFKKGHRIMVQVQSSWFPLVDRNPQQFVDIYHCDRKDFVPSLVKIYSSGPHSSKIILPVIN